VGERIMGMGGKKKKMERDTEPEIDDNCFRNINFTNVSFFARCPSYLTDIFLWGGKTKLERRMKQLTNICPFL
jgi:hypothetical protein